MFGYTDEGSTREYQMMSRPGDGKTLPTEKISVETLCEIAATFGLPKVDVKGLDKSLYYFPTATTENNIIYLRVFSYREILDFLEII
jgi:hypothetical protein